MKRKTALVWFSVLVALVLVVGTRIQAGEIVYADDIRDNVVTMTSLVKTADNIIVLLDTSGSMARPNKALNKSYYELQVEALTKGVNRLPNLGYNLGVYRFTPWEALYPIQPFDATKVQDALKKLPAKPAGASPLMEGLDSLESVLKGLRGRTFVYLFSDGGYSRIIGTGSPVDKTAEMAKKYEVCFQVIDYADNDRDKKTLLDMAKCNYCSRVIPFDAYITQPYYAIGPLFYTRWDTEVITTSSKKVAGYKVKNINFQFNQFDVPASGQDELNGVAKFLADKPNAYAVLFGFTDDSGKPEYNMELSRRRAEAVADYLYNKFKIGPDRVIPIWYGEANPIAGNDTEEGRAKNRRVEVSVGGV
jgi:OmpA-OmpF porin, OOP family